MVAVLVLLTLLAAPLVLAQQDPGQNVGQDQPAAPAQTPPINLGDPFTLDANGNLTVDCGMAFSNLAQLEPFRTVLANDQTFQSKLADAESLVQLCTNNGFSPFGDTGAQPPGSTTGNQYQPQA
jgi:hypothetical protein